MLKDALLELQAEVTKTAAFNGASIDLGTGTALRGMVAELIVTAVEVGTDETYVFAIEESDDDAAFNLLTTFDFPAAAQAGTVGAFFRTFSTRKQFVRLIVTMAGTAESATYSGHVGISRPT